MGPGKRCKGGYHLRGTIPSTNNGDTIPKSEGDTKNSDGVPQVSIPQSPPQQGGNVVIDPANLKDFLGKLIREEMAAAMIKQPSPSLTQPPQPAQPQQPTQQQQPQQQHPLRFQSSQDYRMALIGELLSRH